MNYANIKNCDIANGLGVRVSLFVSGCTHHCPGCFNQIAWDFNYGKDFNKEVQDKIIELLSPSYIDGFSILGGEPFEIVNQRSLVDFVKRVKQTYPNKDIWAWSGYLFDSEILVGRAHCEVTDELLKYIDVLVDGKFIIDLLDISLKYRGSSNQRIINVKKSLESKSVFLVEDLMK